MITYINGVDWMACQKDKNRQISIFFIEINSAIHQIQLNSAIHQILFTRFTRYSQKLPFMTMTTPSVISMGFIHMYF